MLNLFFIFSYSLNLISTRKTTHTFVKDLFHIHTHKPTLQRKYLHTDITIIIPCTNKHWWVHISYSTKIINHIIIINNQLLFTFTLNLMTHMTTLLFEFPNINLYFVERIPILWEVLFHYHVHNICMSRLSTCCETYCNQWTP